MELHCQSKTMTLKVANTHPHDFHQVQRECEPDTDLTKAEPLTEVGVNRILIQAR